MNIIRKLTSPLFRRAAQKHLLTGKRKKALVLFQMLYDWSPSVENQFNLALCLMNMRHFKEACALFKTVHDKLPDQLFAGVTYAQCLLLEKRFDEAKCIYERLLESNQSNHTLPLLIALCSDTVGRDKYVTSLDLQFQASLLQEEGQYRTALDMLQTAAGLTPEDAALHNNLGALKLKLKYPVEAVMADFARAMELSPENDRYQRNYRRVWLKVKK